MTLDRWPKKGLTALQGGKGRYLSGATMGRNKRRIYVIKALALSLERFNVRPVARRLAEKEKKALNDVAKDRNEHLGGRRSSTGKNSKKGREGVCFLLKKLHPH